MRLTARGKYGNAYFPCANCDRYADSCTGGVFADCIMELAERLAMYEDAEEQGLLVRLPCKVGDTIYYLDPYDGIKNGKITMIQQKADGTWKFRVTTDFSHARSLTRCDASWSQRT